MKRYGLPYKGSKNAIARAIIETLPEADIFIDLFAGGCAVTHAAMESGKYRRVIANDICTYPQFFKECIEGKHTIQTHPEWISREDFQRLKDTDDYVKYVWSFGNNGCSYLYSKEIEPWKRALYLARAQGDFSGMKAFGIETDGSRADIVAHMDEYKGKYIKWYMKNVLMSEREYEIEKQNLEGKIKDESEKLRAYLIKARDDAGYKSSDVDKYLGTNGMAGHYYGCSQWEFPTREVYIRLQQIMPGLNQDYDDIAGLAILWQRLQSLQSLQGWKGC
ncbi:MAG: DNA adenine methylase [Acutalibacteraceae bacterium]|nr:DNA adenine methylase [Acutalibacteraceae bacterium]